MGAPIAQIAAQADGRTAYSIHRVESTSP
jgi:hypothetical protein